MESLGTEDLASVVVEGTKFNIRLTPAARDVPGVSPPRRSH